MKEAIKKTAAKVIKLMKKREKDDPEMLELLDEVAALFKKI